MQQPDTIRILALGDCVGRPGRRALREGIPVLREHKRIDFVVANVENAVNGWGLNPAKAAQILECGVDVMTSGDHIRDRREIDPYLESETRVLKPLNYRDMPGRGVYVYDGPRGVKIGIANIAGKLFMPCPDPVEGRPFDMGNPLLLADEAIAAMGNAPIKLVDLHGEVTSEKVALGWYLDGRASAVWGTHTHVQTADETVLPKGTGYITDLGFTGGHKSVLGRDVGRVINKLLDRSPAYMEVADEWPQLDGAIFEIETVTGRCVSVERVRHRIE